MVLVNKRRASGDYRLIGRDLGGRYITVVIAATHDPLRWRPITARYSNAAEQARARQQRI
jgi:hypothetical protein